MNNVTVEIADAIAVVTLDRPEAMNALSRALRRDFDAAMQAVDADDAVRVIILTGAGSRAFSAGLDLKELGSDPDALLAANATAPDQNPVAAVERCRKPVIGAVNGVAITGGFELALACDVLIAADTARFADTHARVGIIPGWGLSQKLSRLIGIYRARELAFTGNFVDAATAERWGLVNRVVPSDVLMSTARRLAADMATTDPGILADYKSLINQGFARDYGAALALEAKLSTAHNALVTPKAVEERRGAVQERGRVRQDGAS